MSSSHSKARRLRADAARVLWKRLGTTHRDLRYSEPGCGRVSAPPAGAAGALAKGYLAFESAYLRGER